MIKNGIDTQLQKSSQKLPSISLLKFPFILKKDQIAAVNAWINNNHRGTILYSTGTGKTEIAFECAKILATRNLSNDTQSLHSKKSVTDINKTPKHDQKEVDSSLNQNNHDIVTNNNDNNENVSCSFFNILFLVPRTSLIDQTINRLISYGVPKETVAAYFGERKEVKEITICTYQSVVRKPRYNSESQYGDF